MSTALSVRPELVPPDALQVLIDHQRRHQHEDEARQAEPHTPDDQWEQGETDDEAGDPPADPPERVAGQGCLRDRLDEARVLLGQPPLDLFEDALLMFGERHRTLGPFLEQQAHLIIGTVPPMDYSVWDQQRIQI